MLLLYKAYAIEGVCSFGLQQNRPMQPDDDFVRHELHVPLLALERKRTLTMNLIVRTRAALLALLLLPSIAAADSTVQLNVLGMD